MKNLILLIGLIIFYMIECSSVSSVLAEDKMTVTFVSCCKKDGFFWPKVHDFMIAAAEDLQIDVEILYAEMNHFKMVDMVQAVVNRPNPPDYLIVDNYKKRGGKMIHAASVSGVKVFLMANGLDEKQGQEYGRPREKYSHWIGEFTPDNRFAGYRLAKAIIDRALSAALYAKDGKLHLVAISGDLVTPASVQRVAGLREAVAEYPNVVLKQVVPGDWNEKLAQERACALLRRYAELGAIWVANDEMALAIIEVMATKGKTPGKDFFIGGVNWKKEALEQVKKETLCASIGGHFMFGAWSLVLLYDYHHGKDFADEGVQIQQRLFRVIDAWNVDQYLSVFGDENWKKIDFTKFSKVLNPKLSKYEFSLEALLRQGL